MTDTKDTKEKEQSEDERAAHSDDLEAAQKYADGGASTLYHTRVAAFLKGIAHGRNSKIEAGAEYRLGFDRGMAHGREKERERIWNDIQKLPLGSRPEFGSYDYGDNIDADEVKRIIFGRGIT